jgi:chromosome segregation ATPase
MFFFRKMKREFAETKSKLESILRVLADCKGELEDCKVERAQARFDANQANEALHQSMAETAALREKLSVTEVKLSNSQAETRTYFTAHEADKAAHADAEAYKKDNITLIGRVASLQDQLAQSEGKCDTLQSEYANLQDTVQDLLLAVEKARAKKTKAKKKKTSKKKRK